MASLRRPGGRWRPDDYAGAVDGCAYELAWSRHTGAEEDPHDEP